MEEKCRAWISQTGKGHSTYFLNLDIPIGASKPDSRKLSSGGMHYQLLDHFHLPRDADHDGPGEDVMAATMTKHLDCEFLVIGP